VCKIVTMVTMVRWYGKISHQMIVEMGQMRGVRSGNITIHVVNYR
jgi:hypothetical protein